MGYLQIGPESAQIYSKSADRKKYLPIEKNIGIYIGICIGKCIHNRQIIGIWADTLSNRPLRI